MSSANLLIEHRVPGNLYSVFDGFTRELFDALAPSFPPVKLLRYDGKSVGDIVHLRLGVWPIYQHWVSEITAHECYQRQCYFVDEGRRLPWPLTAWRHKHLVAQVSASEVIITEDISFSTNFPVLTKLMRPIIQAQFEARGPKYLEFFRRQHKPNAQAQTQ